MRKLVSACLIMGMCLSLAGCGNKDDGNTATVKLSDYPKVEEKSDKTLKELENAPSIKETKTKIKYKEASSNTGGIIALHYETANDGEIVIQYDEKSANVHSATVTMKKENAEKSQDYIAIISAFASISDFDITDDEYQQIGEVAMDMKTTKVGDLTVSMNDLDGIYEFMIIKK